MTEEVADLEAAVESIVNAPGGANSCGPGGVPGKPLSHQERINEASCSGKPANRLPSSDPDKERDDCRAEIDAAARR